MMRKMVKHATWEIERDELLKENCGKDMDEASSLYATGSSETLLKFDHKTHKPHSLGKTK